MMHISTLKRFSHQAFIPTHPERYMLILLIIAPALNFLCGTNVDLYAPSLPAIAQYFNIPEAIAQNSISAGLIGFGAACLFVGILMEYFGRRRVIITGLLLFTLTSLIAPYAFNIQMLYTIRFIQGATAAIASIGSRALVIDEFSGKQYVVAMLYTSVTYSLGMMIGPFIGGHLQTYFDWQASFYAYAIIAGSLLIAFALWVNESQTQQSAPSIQATFRHYCTLIKHRPFLAGSSLVALVMLQQLVYPTFGPFILTQQLHLSAQIYGDYALLVGLCYLAGNLFNRVLHSYYSTQQLQKIGLRAILIASALQILIGSLAPLNIWLIMLPILAANFSIGFVFGNTIAITLSHFPKLASLAAGLMTFIMLIGSTLCISSLSLLNIHSAIAIGGIFLISASLQLLLLRAM